MSKWSSRKPKIIVLVDTAPVLLVPAAVGHAVVVIAVTTCTSGTRTRCSCFHKKKSVTWSKNIHSKGTSLNIYKYTIDCAQDQLSLWSSQMDVELSPLLMWWISVTSWSRLSQKSIYVFHSLYFSVSCSTRLQQSWVNGPLTFLFPFSTTTYSLGKTFSEEWRL